MDMERLQKQFEFILEMDKEKQIMRRTHIHGYSRNESDAEHAWHMALMTMLLSEYSNEPIDVLHTIEMLIVHDLVEVDAGDTYAYDAKGNETKAQREQAAADRIYGLLPEDQGKRLRALWDEFEESKTPEAKFAHVMDNIQPMMLNAANDGKDWKSNSVRLKQILKRNEITPDGSHELWDFARENFINPHIEKGNILE